MNHSLWDNVLNNAVGNLGTCTKLIETIDKSISDELTKRLENCVEEYCNIDIIHQSTKQALHKTQKYYAVEEYDFNTPPNKTFDKYFKDINKENKTKIENHHLHDIYNTESKTTESTEAMEIGDDDIITMNQFVLPMDPISKEPIKNPVRNKQCGHIYDKDTITQMMARKKTRCPYIGCPSKHHIRVEILEADHDLKRKIDQQFLNA